MNSVKMMGSDSLLLEMLETEDNSNEFEDRMKKYLTGIQNSNDFFTISYLVSNKTYNYYTTNGIAKQIDPENNDYDYWYISFKNSSKTISIDINTDENNNDLWTIFVDYKLYSSEGIFLGACGIGILLNSLQEILAEYNKTYDVDVFFQDKDGNLILDANKNYMESPAYSNTEINAKNNEFNYVEDDKYIRGKYINDLGWFLVVSNSTNPFTSIIYYFVVTIIILVIIIIALFVIANLIISHLDRKQLSEKIVIDSLTNVLNRAGFEEEIKERLHSNKKECYLMMTDLDNFKSVNDELGHNVGDETIILAAHTYRDIVKEYGFIGRIGGDEFIIYAEGERDEITNLAAKMISSLEKEVTDGLKKVNISTSIGIVQITENANYLELYKKADLALYKAKENGKNCFYFDNED